MSLLRRSFLKLGTALVGGAVIAQYAEPLIAIPAKPKLRDWIEDKGDHYIVRIPAMKEFASEILDKPTIFLLGQSAVVREVMVRGFANIMAPKAGVVTGCHFDASKMAVSRNRAVLEIAHSNGLHVIGCSLAGNGFCLSHQTATP